MSEFCDSLSVVFTDSPKIEDHLFAKAIRWADQNPEDVVFWARKKALERIPDVDVDWSSKIRALRRIRFGYNRKNLVLGCINEAIKSSMDSDIAAIFCSLSIPKTCSEMGSLLAALASFCNGNDGRAVVVIDLKEDNEIDEGEEEEAEETDPFENSDFLAEEEQKAGEVFKEEKVEDEKSEKEKENFLKKLKIVSRMYTNNVLNFNGDGFSKCA
ncbi:hypothetical protein B9Z55_009537 [Caenorhabditis nigoni]|uniref:Uncharacterized protein n=1 Tax=Caenorhabditis nigoni TaxID=1611254 RepID=A0A2G5UT73_9PELO|nr:hypothetical protein B9Z55_009537 [Caenorhabditis nigoni]